MPCLLPTLVSSRISDEESSKMSSFTILPSTSSSCTLAAVSVKACPRLCFLRVFTRSDRAAYSSRSVFPFFLCPSIGKGPSGHYTCPNWLQDVQRRNDSYKLFLSYSANGGKPLHRLLDREFFDFFPLVFYHRWHTIERYFHSLYGSPQLDREPC